MNFNINSSIEFDQIFYNITQKFFYIGVVRDNIFLSELFFLHQLLQFLICFCQFFAIYLPRSGMFQWDPFTLYKKMYSSLFLCSEYKEFCESHPLSYPMRSDVSELGICAV